MLTKEQASQLKAEYGTVTVQSWAMTEADATYDWVVGKSMLLVSAIDPKDHDSPYLCIEDTKSFSRWYNTIKIVNRYGDHLTTINLERIIRSDWDVQIVKDQDAAGINRISHTIDARFPMAIYATEETLKPRRMQVEPLYRQEAATFTVAYKGRRALTKRKL